MRKPVWVNIGLELLIIALSSWFWQFLNPDEFRDFARSSPLAWLFSWTYGFRRSDAYTDAAGAADGLLTELILLFFTVAYGILYFLVYILVRNEIDVRVYELNQGQLDDEDVLLQIGATLAVRVAAQLRIDDGSAYASYPEGSSRRRSQSARYYQYQHAYVSSWLTLAFHVRFLINLLAIQRIQRQRRRTGAQQPPLPRRLAQASMYNLCLSSLGLAYSLAPHPIELLDCLFGSTTT